MCHSKFFFFCFRTRDSDRERSERLDAAYEEMMNDDDFDDMVIENQTTMHVNKTPVSSAYTKTRTDLGSKSSTVDNESNRNISDIVNRGIERIIGQGGDNSRTAGDSRTSRVESPLPGTSKDDSQSPVIPILQQGTKVCFHNLAFVKKLASVKKKKRRNIWNNYYEQ